MMEYVIVDFPDRREVLVDGAVAGYTRDLGGEPSQLRIDEGTHRFRLRGPDDYIPLWLTVDVFDTNVNEPLTIFFTKKA